MYTIEGPLSSAFEMGASNDPNYVKQRGRKTPQPSLASALILISRPMLTS